MITDDSVFVLLAARKNYLAEVEIAVELDISVPLARKHLKNLGDAVENDGDGNWRVVKTVVPEVVDNELSDEEQKEFLRLERKIERGIQAFFKLGEALRTIREQKLYRGGYETFEIYCQQRFGFTRRNVNYLISAAKVVLNLKNANFGNNCSQTVLKNVLPTSEFQVRSLAKLKPEEQVEIWQQAIKTNNGKMPTGKQILNLVNEQKAMKKASKIEDKLERFQCGDVVRITAKYNVDLKNFHNFWGTIYSLEEFSYTVLTYKTTISGVRRDDLMAVKQADREETRLLLEQMTRLHEKHGKDPDFHALLHFQASKPIPEISPVTKKIFDFLI